MIFLDGTSQIRFQEGTHLTCWVGNHWLCDYVSARAGDEHNNCICSCHIQAIEKELK